MLLLELEQVEAQSLLQVRSNLEDFVKRVEFGYLFGSFVRGEDRKDSDIAVFVKDYEGLPLNFEQKLALKIEQKIKKQVEIVVINQAPTSLLLEVLKQIIIKL